MVDTGALILRGDKAADDITLSGKADLTAAISAVAGGILAAVAYAPAVLEAIATTVTTWASVDATNLAVSFTVPASGKVLVRPESCRDQSSNARCLWGLLDGGSLVPGSDGHLGNTSGLGIVRLPLTVLLTGLTPGASKTYTWGHRLVTAVGNGRVIYGGPGGGDAYGPASMVVSAA